MGNRLNPEQRQRYLTALAEEDFDVVVVGGGVTGAGIALDAASRGLKTAVIEAQDWAAGTSSRSTGLVLGGLRYLYQLDLALVTELVRERGLLLNTIAPHLVRPQPFIWPQWSRLVDRAQSATGIGLYDLLTVTIGGRALPPHRQHTRSGTIERFPGVCRDALIGSAEFYDAKVDDARLVINIVRTAIEYGAIAVSRVEVVRMTRAADAPVTGLVVRDLESGNELSVRTRGVILATGVWTEHTQALAETNSGLKVLASKGVHLLVPKDRIDSKTGVFFRTRDSAVWLVPMDNHWLIGTTDTVWRQPLLHPVVTRDDIDNLLTEVNKVLARPLTRDDVYGSYAGLRPLLQQSRLDDARTTHVSREHGVAQVAPGIVAVAGGKLTAYRRMAAEAVDFLLGKPHAAEHPSVTDRTPLLGAQGLAAMTNQSERIGGIYGWRPEQMTHLLHRYGSELPGLLELVDDDPTMAAHLRSAPEYLRVEVAWACVAEGALHLEDLLMRRLRLDVDCVDRGAGVAEEVANIAAPLLDWDAERCAREEQNYLAAVAAESAAARQRTDVAALTERRRAGDIVESGLGAI